MRLKHSKGLSYLQTLIDNPGRQVHVLELAGIDDAIDRIARSSSTWQVAHERPFEPSRASSRAACPESGHAPS